MHRKIPRVVEWLFRVRYGKSSEFVLGDVMEEYTKGGLSRRWVWRQLWSTYAPPAPDPPIQGEAHMFWPLSNDIRYAARTLARNRGFAAVAILSIALGVGINSAIFSLFNAAAFRPLPVADSGKLVSVYQIFNGKFSRSVNGADGMFSTSEYQTYRETNHVFRDMVAYSPFLKATLGGETPRQIIGTYASCNYFDVLGAPPAAGRGFLPADCAAAGTGAVTVLGDDLWRQRFSADPAIVGKTVILNRQAFTVVGIARPGFHGAEAVDSSFWVPFTSEPILESNSAPNTFGNRNMSWLVVMGKLKDGESMAHARADLSVIAAQVDRLYPGRTTALSIGTSTFASMPEVHTIVFGVGAVVLTAVAMVLLIVCANLANLLLARAVGRQKEIAIRLSLGATRAQLIRQLMTESLMIALAGGLLGCAASLVAPAVILRIIMSHVPGDVPQFNLHFGPDPRVLGYSLALTVITGLAFGLTPALRATKIDPRGAADRKNGLLRGGLVGAQVTVCMVLLIAAGLLLHALYAAQTVDPGFSMSNIVTASCDLRNQGYTDGAAAQFQQQLTDRAAALPGVDAVARAWVTPLSANHVGYGITPSGSSQERSVEINVVSPGYFSMLELPIVRGREFTTGEKQSAIISESAARNFWAGSDAIGKTIAVNSDSVYQVVGVARDAEISHLGKSHEVYVYLTPGKKDQMHLQLLVHSRVNQQQAIHRIIQTLDPNLAFTVASLEDNLEWWRTPLRIVGILAGTLGGLALLLASLGIYGVAAFAVSRRTREIGIRMALGADSKSVQALILRQSMRPVLIGSVLGIAGCAAVSKVLAGILFGVSAYDPAAFVCVPILLIAIASLASHLPARRAATVDPMVALRHD